MVNHWIFIARRKEGTLREMQNVIKDEVWDFISRDGNPKKPQFYKELNIGDFVLIYLAVTYPNGKKIKGGRSIIGKARLGSPYLIYGEYIINNENEETNEFVFLTCPDIKFNKRIEPKKYRIGQQAGQMVVKISKNEYDDILRA